MSSEERSARYYFLLNISFYENGRVVFWGRLALDSFSREPRGYV
jgi:hypothetical protein